MALALNNSITRNIKRLTATARALRAGNLAVRPGSQAAMNWAISPLPWTTWRPQLQETLDNERDARQDAETARQQEMYQRSETGGKASSRYRALFSSSRAMPTLSLHAAGKFIALKCRRA